MNSAVEGRIRDLKVFFYTHMEDFKCKFEKLEHFLEQKQFPLVCFGEDWLSYNEINLFNIDWRLELFTSTHGGVFQ